MKALVDRVNTTSNANFVQRLKDPNRKTIRDWSGKNEIATHRLSYATDDNGAIIYPEVQEINDQLYDFTDPNNGKTWRDAFKRAVETGDTIRTNSSELADYFTKNYKKYYPF